MGKGRFVNQKLGKRVNRKLDLLKSRLTVEARRNPAGHASLRRPKKGSPQHPPNPQAFVGS